MCPEGSPVKVANTDMVLNDLDPIVELGAETDAQKTLGVKSSHPKSFIANTDAAADFCNNPDMLPYVSDSLRLISLPGARHFCHGISARHCERVHLGNGGDQTYMQEKVHVANIPAQHAPNGQLHQPRPIHAVHRTMPHGTKFRYCRRTAGCSMG
jgi:hypothetical protein